MRALPICICLLVSCGAPPVELPSPPKLFETVAASPVTGSALPKTTVNLGEDVVRVGLSLDGTLVAGTTQSTWELVGGALEKRTLYAAAGEQTSLGAVTSIAPRLAGGAWLSAANGLFVLQGEYVTKSPLTAGTFALEQPRGPLAGLWLGTPDGLVRRTVTTTQRFTVDGRSPQVDRLAIEPNGNAAIAVIGGLTLVLRADATGLTSERPPLAMPVALAVAASADTLYAATSSGLWRYAAKAEGLAWTRMLLSSGTEPKLLEALAVDPVSGALWARATSELIKLEGDTATTYPAAMTMAGFTVDRLGDLWLPEGKSLHQVKTGSAMPVSFATQLKPWLTKNCTACHADFAEPGPFAMRAENALARVLSGDMPRCTGGLPCPSGQRLTDTAVLEQWIRNGKQP